MIETKNAQPFTGSGLDRAGTGAATLAFALGSAATRIATIVFAGCNAVEIATTAGTVYVYKEQFVAFLRILMHPRSI